MTTSEITAKIEEMKSLGAKAVRHYRGLFIIKMTNEWHATDYSGTRPYTMAGTLTSVKHNIDARLAG